MDIEKYIEIVMMEIREGIDRAREAGINCFYPEYVEFEIPGKTNLLVRFYVKTEGGK